jgi:hypothetical protein
MSGQTRAEILPPEPRETPEQSRLAQMELCPSPRSKDA